MNLVDRFHVMKLVNKAFTNIRLQVGLKGLRNRCLLGKNNQDLTEEERRELSEVLTVSPCLAIAYELHDGRNEQQN
jgi:hypothetical protein